ncbi:MAG: molybdopterin-dependent oxidoreductase, partial [Desulfobacterales bacterium]|nr:molybdopterin-dependent oxidoreductase [Desulfobacterales bacterium]
FAHSKILYGSPSTVIVPDLDNIDYFLALGTNPKASHFSFLVVPQPLRRLQEMEERGGRIVWVNPRKTEAAQKTGEHHYIKPNTDIYFVFALIHYILENNLEDKALIKEYTKGIDGLRAIAGEFGKDLEKIERLTGISGETIIKIAKDFSEASKKGSASIYGRVGTDRGPFATLLAWAIDILNIITGNIDKKGNFCHTGLADTSGLLKLSGEISGNGDMWRQTVMVLRLMRLFVKNMGFRHFIKSMSRSTGKRSKKSTGSSSENARSRIGNFPPVLGTFPAALMADEILTPGKGQIKSMIVMAGDPLISCANTMRLENAFRELELLVSIDFFINDTGILADYILPAATFLEREDFAVSTSSYNTIPFVNFSKAIVTPNGEEKQEWEMFNLLSEQADVPILGSKPYDVYKALLTNKDRKRFEKLLTSEKGIYLYDDQKIKYNVILPEKILFPDKLIPLVPDKYENEFNKLRKWELADDTEYPFLLISGRQVETLNSWIHERINTNQCYINSEDAKALQLENDQLVRIISKVGSIEITIKTTPHLMQGVIWVPHGWGRTVQDVPDMAVEKRGVNINLITDDDWTKLETFAGMVMLDGVPVRVEKT